MRRVASPELSSLITGERPVLACFYSNWCLSSCAMSPIIERIADRFGARVEVVKINVDRSRAVAEAFGVGRVPAFLLFASGSVVGALVGSPTENELAALVAPREPERPDGTTAPAGAAVVYSSDAEGLDHGTRV